MRRVGRIWVFAGAVLSWFGLSAPTSASIAFATDVYFAHNSARLTASQAQKLDSLFCGSGRFLVEGAYGSGHAAANEDNPQKLAIQRAERVTAYIQSLRILPTDIVGKGATQPTADNRLPEGRAKNRRVEVDLGFTVPDTPGNRDDICLPQWVKHMLADTSTAPVVARAWIRDYDLAADAPFVAALQAKRFDVFQALVDNAQIALTLPQAEHIAQRAVEAGQLDYALHWAHRNQARLTASERSHLLRAVCASPTSQGDVLVATAQLYRWGIRSTDAAPLRCAVDSGLGDLVDFYLRVDGVRYLDANVTVMAGPSPPILHRFLVAGADVKAKSGDGRTLFHTTRLLTVGDVERLLEAGLDINAPSATGATAMQQALAYAPLSVLAFMRQRGARLDGIDALAAARLRTEAQVWLLDQGLVPSAAEIADVLPPLIKQGDAALPVLRALVRAPALGFFESDNARSALAQAIQEFQVPVVRLLVDASVSLDASTVWKAGQPAMTALERAKALVEYDIWRPCTSAVPIKWCPKEHGPILIEDLAQKKQRIITLIEAAELERRKTHG